MKGKAPIEAFTIVVALLLLVSSVAGCLGGDDDDDNGDKKEDPVLANAGPDAFGEAGDVIELNASASSGPIQRYTWTIWGPNASSTENITLAGDLVDHAFTEAGVYSVSLFVEGKKEGNNHTDTKKVFIDLVDEVTASLQGVQTFNRTYEYRVWPEVQAITLTLTYPSTAGAIPLPVNLDMDVWTDGQTPYATSTTQTPDPQDTQTEVLELQLQGVIDSGGFRVVVRWGPASNLAAVDFTLDVDINYRAV